MAEGELCRVRDQNKKTDVVWTSYSPDHNPMDFFLWGYLKDCVYTEKPQTIEELKNANNRHIRRINSVADLDIDNFRHRIGRERNGSHKEHLLFFFCFFKFKK